MTSINQLYLDKAIFRHGIKLFNKQDALEFIEVCKISGVNLLGIDAFYLLDEKLQPSLEDSADFSSHFFTKAIDVSIYEYAEAFLKSKSNDLMFEIVIDGRNFKSKK